MLKRVHKMFENMTKIWLKQAKNSQKSKYIKNKPNIGRKQVKKRPNVGRKQTKNRLKIDKNFVKIDQK